MPLPSRVRTRPVRVAITGFSGLDDPGPGAAVARALRAARSRPMELAAWIYGAADTTALLPGIVDRIEVLPPADGHDEALIEAIAEANATHRIDALLAGDTDVAALARLEPRLAALKIRTLLPPAHRADALARRRLGTFLHAHDFAMPFTVTAPEVAEAPSLATRIGFPLAVRGMDAGEQLVHTPAQAQVAAARLGAMREGVILQHQPPAERFSSGLVIDREGAVRSCVSMKVVATNGEGRIVTGTIVHLDALDALARRIALAADWRGALTIDILQPHATGAFLVADVRPHLPHWCLASHWGGANLALSLLDATLAVRRRRMHPRAGTMFVRGIGEAAVALDDLLALRRRGRIDALDHGGPVAAPRVTRGKRGLVVAVTGASTFDVVNPGLGVARALRGAPEIERIYGLAYGTLESGAYQGELFDEVFRLPDARDYDRLAARIAEIHRDHPFDVLMPCLDGELPLFIRMKPHLDALGIRHLLPSQRAFDRRCKRDLFSGRLRSDWGSFVIPESRFARDEDEAAAATRVVGLPAVVKGPLFLCHHVETGNAARAAWRDLAASGWREAIVQRRIAGPHYATSVVLDRGSAPIATVTIKKLATCARGSTWNALRVEEPALATDFTRLLAHIGWVGPAEGEFIRDEVTDRFHLIEVNPRFTGWIYYSAALGCNQPRTAVLHAMGQPQPVEAAPAPVAFVRHTTDFPLRPSQLATLATRGHLRHA